MTCCVAAICDKKKSIVLVSDKMIGTQMIESEPEITKVIPIHPNWRIMFAGDDICQVFPIADAARLTLSGRKRAPTLKQVCNAVYECYSEERSRQSEAIHLAPLGWNRNTFNSAKSAILPEALREELLTKIADHRVGITLLVAGFGSTGNAHIFSVDDNEDRGKPRIQDLPGYHAIGSGGEAAMYMMAYREMSAAVPLRLALYYAVEGKYFGEKSGGVGTKTDAWVMRSGLRPFKMSTEALEESLFDLCMRLEPRPIRRQQVDVLNQMKGTALSSVPKLEARKKDDEWIVETVKSRKSTRA